MPPETEPCPTTTFDGESLYERGRELDSREVPDRRARRFDPYHVALDGEVARLRQNHRRVVVYDCHSIRSSIPRLFGGRLPVYDVGTDDGTTCDPSLSHGIEELCAASGSSYVLNGMVRGGYITRRLGRPADGVHAVQMELACRGSLREPEGEVGPSDWPRPYEPSFAEPIRATLAGILERCPTFALSR